jgi:hypothetical protein
MTWKNERASCMGGLTFPKKLYGQHICAVIFCRLSFTERNPCNKKNSEEISLKRDS